MLGDLSVTSSLRSKIVVGAVVAFFLAGIALYQIDEWWPGCNFVRVSPDGDPLMIAAAKEGCTGCVRTVLRRGADPNAGDDIHGTPLVAAVQYGNYWTARLLLKRGAHVNAGIGWGTALCQAVMTENPDKGMIELLLESGATLQWAGDAEQPDRTVFDCLHHSDVGPQPSEESRRFTHLINHGLVNTFANLPERRQAELLVFLYDDEVRQLARHGAKLNLDVRDSYGQTILTQLVTAPGLCNRVRLLISEGAQYSPKDTEFLEKCAR